jgi:hypothetical protein
MAQVLGVSDAAAQKRVSRAVERLREFLAKRGIIVGTGGLAGAITASAVQCAPVGLAATIGTSTPIAGVTIATGVASKAIAMTTLQKVLILTILASAIGIGIYKSGEASRLGQENQKLIAEQENLSKERDLVLSTASAQSNELEALQKDKSDLLRIHREVAAFRGQLKELERLREENFQLQLQIAKEKVQKTPGTEEEIHPDMLEIRSKSADALLLVEGVLGYATEHQGQVPSSLDYVAKYLTDPKRRLTGTNLPAARVPLTLRGSRLIQRPRCLRGDG